MNNQVDVIAGTGLDLKARKSHWPARLDFVQSACGLFLGLFMWAIWLSCHSHDSGAARGRVYDSRHQYAHGRTRALPPTRHHGIITPFATGPSPVYYGSGYLPAADYWRLGAIFGVIFFAVFLAIGVLWMLAIR